MNIRSNKASSAVLFIISAGLSLGLAYGVVREFHMGLIPSILSLLIVLLIQYFIFTRGRASSYNTAQAWAQAQVDIALEVSNIAQAEAKALAQAYSLAISQAQATATQNTIIHLPDGRQASVLPLQDQEKKQEIAPSHGLWEMTDYQTIYNRVTEGRENAPTDGRVPQMAMGEFDEESTEIVRTSPDC